MTLRSDILSAFVITILITACGRLGYETTEILRPITFDDGRQKVSAMLAAAMPMSGSCNLIGGFVLISGDGVGTAQCDTGGRWESLVDFSAAADGPVVVVGILTSAESTIISPPTQRFLVKDTSFCAQSGRMEASPFADGDGSEAAPYRICSKKQFLEVNNYLSAFLRLENDIDLKEDAWTPLGTLSGEFDGNGFAVINMHFVYSDYPSGLFKDATGRILNLSVLDASTWGYCHVGAVVGILYSGASVHRCHASGKIHSYSDAVGGLVGQNLGHITESSTRVHVADSSDYGIGGLVGVNEGSGLIERCFSSGPLMALGAKHVGGLVGVNHGEIRDSYATGALNGNEGAEHVGGLVGENNHQVLRCLSTGAVSGKSTGGLVARNSGQVESSFWDLMRSNQESSAGGRGLSSQSMRSPSSFADWDLENTWRLDEATMEHPILAWQ